MIADHDLDTTHTSAAHGERTLTRRDRAFIVGFLVLPVLLFLPSTLAGHPIVPGDDLNQNLPLRILAGEVIRSGRLPAWDPLIWSGTPLLAGWNAGALFPGTLLFAFLPAMVAWVLNLIAIPFVSCCGLYLFARRLGRSELAAGLGALVFSYTGFMSGQIVHIGLVQGTAFTPWILLGIEAIFAPADAGAQERHRLARFAGLTGRLCWVAVLGVAVAATVLAGDPRAVSSAAIISLVYFLALVWRRRVTLAALGASVMGALLGVALSAIQWLPGIGFLHSSQRSTAAVSFFGSGSLGLRQISTFMLSPYFLGGNGSFGLPIYTGAYNLPEVTIGVGIVALVAFFAYLPDVAIAFVRTIHTRSLRGRTGSNPVLGVWYVLVVLGFFLTIGTNEPLGRLLVRIPLYGGERLQNRNALLMDLGLAMILVWFIDGIAAKVRSHEDRDSDGEARALARPVARWLALAPVLATGALIAVFLADPTGVERFLDAPSTDIELAKQMLPYLIATLGVAASTAALWWTRVKWSRRTVQAGFGVLVCCDLGLYLSGASFASAPSSLYATSTPASATLTKDLANQGRYALYNPQFDLAGPSRTSIAAAGIPDINVVQGNAGVQGYGSIVNSVYQTVTGTHFLENLDPGVLRGESANTLDLRVFLSLPNYFDEVISTNSPIPLPGGRSTAPPGTPAVDLPPRLPQATGPWSIAPGASFEWRLPQPSALSRATLILGAPPSRPPAHPVTLPVTLSGPRGVSAVRSARVAGTHASVRLDDGSPSDALTLTNTTKATLEVQAVVVITANPALRLVLDGRLQGVLSSTHWTYDGTVGPLVAFKNTRTRGIAWLQPANSPTPNTAFRTEGSVRLVSNSAVSPQVMVVNSPLPSTLVRSEGYAPGWTARLTPLAGGPVKVLAVHRFGLVQAVNFPVGRYTVTWRYAPPEILEGLVVSAVGLGSLLVIAAIALVTRRRARAASNSRDRTAGVC